VIFQTDNTECLNYKSATNSSLWSMVIAKHIHLLLVAVTLFNFIQCVSTRHHCFHVCFGLLLQPCESVHIALFKCSPCLQCIWPIRRHFLCFICSVTEKRDAFTIIFGETLCHHREQTYNILLPQFKIPRRIGHSRRVLRTAKSVR
jgi:hypothetical protein